MNQAEDMQVFVNVVDSGSFTAAAERLGIAKSAVSRKLSGLEERLGVQLLRRTTRRLNLTQTGRSYYDRCVRILADLAEVESAVRQEHGKLSGRLRVGLPLSFGLRHMNKLVANFCSLHPDVQFDFDFNDSRIDLIAEQIDVAIRIGRLSDSTLIARKLFDVHSVVCAAPEYLERAGTPQTLEDLHNHACLVYSNLSDPYRWSGLDSKGKKRSVILSAAMTVNNGDFLCAAAAQGLGIVMQPSFIAYEAIRNGELVPVLDDYSWSTAAAYAVYPPARHLSYRVRAFIDFLAESFAGRPYWDTACVRGGQRARRS